MLRSAGRGIRRQATAAEARAAEAEARPQRCRGASCLRRGTSLPVADPAWVADHARSVWADQRECCGHRAASRCPAGAAGGAGRADAGRLPREPDRTHRYGWDNDQYGPGHATWLHAMLRHLRPRRAVEIGAGWSSALALDVNEHHLGNSMAMTLIEPNPERLRSRLRAGDEAIVRILDQPVQEVGLEPFLELGRGDVCMIDSTHVSKIGSDVNHLVFRVLPALSSGVVVHVHDMFWPFEYPGDWALEDAAGPRPTCCGRSWSSTTPMTSCSGTTTWFAATPANWWPRCRPSTRSTRWWPRCRTAITSSAAPSGFADAESPPRGRIHLPARPRLPAPLSGRGLGRGRSRARTDRWRCCAFE